MQAIQLDNGIKINTDIHKAFQSKKRMRDTDNNIIQKKPQKNSLAHHSIMVRENDWFVTKENTSYIVCTSGCGAIKLFVSGKEKENDYSIVFHSYGTEQSIEAAMQIADYINYGMNKTKSIRILQIEPYGISKSIANTVNIISRNLRKNADLNITQKIVVLDNIEGEKYANFINVDLKGTEKEIIDSHSQYISKVPTISHEERNEKIAMFVKIPYKYKTESFIRKWGTLNLEEAKKVYREIENKNKSLFRRIFDCLIIYYKKPYGEKHRQKVTTQR